MRLPKIVTHAFSRDRPQSIFVGVSSMVSSFVYSAIHGLKHSSLVLVKEESLFPTRDARNETI
jgi:hypothetical protein